MKKLLSIVCSLFFMHSFSQSPVEQSAGTQGSPGEKVLIKAIAVIINPEGNKKAPPKAVNLYRSGCL